MHQIQHFEFLEVIFDYPHLKMIIPNVMFVIFMALGSSLIQGIDILYDPLYRYNFVSSENQCKIVQCLRFICIYFDAAIKLSFKQNMTCK